MRVLIIDDEELNVFLVQQLLEEQQYETLGTTSAIKGLEIARKQIPDLILLDIRMPDMDGLSVLAELRANSTTDKIPVIFLTALGQSADVVKGLQMGADEYITKPFGDGQELVARIGTVMRIRNSEGRAMRLAQLLEALQGVSIAINRGLELVTMLETIVKLTVSVGEFDWAGIVLDDRAQSCFSEGVRPESQNILHQEPMRTVMQLGRTVLVTDISKVAGDSHKALHEYGISAYIGVPITLGTQAIGALYGLCKEPSQFSDEQIKTVEGIAMHAAIGISNARLYEQVKMLEEVKSQMLSMGSHDLRNPLTIALNSLSMMEDEFDQQGGLPPLEDQLFQLAQRALNQMQTLIDDVLNTGRIEAMIAKGPEALDVGQVVYQVYESSQLQANVKNQHITVNVADSLPEVRGYLQPLREAIANLVSNAMKYTPENGVITVRASMATHDNHAEVRVEVEDNGLGIPLDRQDRLFEPFYRARQPGTEQISGTGLGLSMVKKVAEQHNGRVWFRSEPGVGSTFALALPAVEAAVKPSVILSEVASTGA